LKFKALHFAKRHILVHLHPEIHFEHRYGEHCDAGARADVMPSGDRDGKPESVSVLPWCDVAERRVRPGEIVIVALLGERDARLIE